MVSPAFAECWWVAVQGLSRVTSRPWLLPVPFYSWVILAACLSPSSPYGLNFFLPPKHADHPSYFSSASSSGGIYYENCFSFSFCFQPLPRRVSFFVRPFFCFSGLRFSVSVKQSLAGALTGGFFLVFEGVVFG